MRSFVAIDKGEGGLKIINPSLVSHGEIDGKGNAVLHVMGGGQISLPASEWGKVEGEFIAEPPPSAEPAGT